MVTCRTSIVLRVVLSVNALVTTNCLLPPLWLTVDNSDAGTADRSKIGSREPTMRTQPVMADDTALDASMPIVLATDAASVMSTSTPDASTATPNASAAGAIGVPCTLANSTIAPCAAGLICVSRAPDMSGVCVDPNSPCLGLSETAICNQQGVMYQCGQGGTIDGQLTCASPAMCYTGLPIGHCRVCEPATYKCVESTQLQCSTDGASWRIVIKCASSCPCA